MVPLCENLGGHDDLDTPESPLDFVVSSNLHRRHLDDPLFLTTSLWRIWLLHLNNVFSALEEVPQFGSDPLGIPDVMLGCNVDVGMAQGSAGLIDAVPGVYLGAVLFGQRV